MPIQKLTSTNAFVAIDIEGAPAAGIVRSAPKILQGGASDLARSLTYAFATLEMQRAGASAGINATPEDRDAAIAAFVEEMTPAAAEGKLSFSAAKGVSVDSLAALSAVDDRHDVAEADVKGDRLDVHLAGLGAVVAADAAVGGLEGKRVLIEGFGEHGPALAEAAVARGAIVVGLSTGNGVQLDADGLDVAALRDGWSTKGDALVGDDADAAWKIFGTEADVLFTGSKMGAINHETAAKLKVGAVVPHAALPYTARALAVMTKNGVIAVPDFVSTAAPLLAYWPADTGSSAQSVAQAATDTITGIVNETKDHDDGGFLGACYRAEAFIKTWQDAAPFGRPLAS